MTKNTNIEWADHTFNPWEGCQKIGPGCDNCYAEARNTRFGGGVAVNWGPGAPRRRTSAANWQTPLKWEREAAAFQAQHGRRQRVFCASLADVFDNAVPVAWRIDLMELIHRTPSLDWLLLTKRIGNVQHMLDQLCRNQYGGPPTWWSDKDWPNVWLGITVVNQEEADRDIPKLLTVPAHKRFLSIEPMLGAVDLVKSLGGTLWIGGQRGCDGTTDGTHYHDERCGPGIDWVIVGGESGPKARPMHPDWVRSLRDQCEAASVPFLFKQWGEHYPAELENDQQIDTPWRKNQGGIFARAWHLDEVGKSRNELPQVRFTKVGKKAAGRRLDGRTWDGFPA